MGDDCMNGDPLFPLYGVVYTFDLGDGTKPETTSLMRPWLFKADPGAAEVERQARLTWPTITFRTPGARRLLSLEVERKPDTEWALAWFAHQTFRAGRSDDELRESFERFVRRYEDLQDYNGPTPPSDYRCLMGAQDRWRWKPLCACDACVRDDVALIAH